jgi:phosphotransferase system HPr (HPr) family protein
MSSASARLVIRNRSGIHARPAAQFVRTAGRFRSKIRVANLSSSKPPVDAKSILSVLPLGISQGMEIEVTAEGDDAEEAIAAIREAVDAGLGEGIDAVAQ